jgi:hypothetical protein
MNRLALVESGSLDAVVLLPAELGRRLRDDRLRHRRRQWLRVAEHPGVVVLVAEIGMQADSEWLTHSLLFSVGVGQISRPQS